MRAVSRAMGRLCGLVGVATVLSSCGSVGPSESVHGDLRAVLTLEPANVKRGEQFTIRVELINESDTPRELSMGSSCAYYTSVQHRNGAPLDGAFPETRYGCLTVISRLVVPANGRFVSAPLVTANVSPGDFEVRIDWTIVDPPLKDLAARLRVLP